MARTRKLAEVQAFFAVNESGKLSDASPITA
jgi:hypothetical protein